MPSRRFNPARAGNTLSGSGRLLRAAVQPRACGEHSRAHWPVACAAGSTPRVRGTPGDPCDAAAGLRFNPARAGNTSGSRVASGATSVQPRACGEHQHPAGGAHVRYGSTPRVRGTLLLRLFGLRIVRFNPARAGNTERSRTSAAGSAVQPRACGEHPMFRTSWRKLTGSTPRVRGTRRLFLGEAVPARFNPARAGNTRRWRAAA